MSLLLDALNRAGKDKAASAAADLAKADNDWPAIGLIPQSVEPESTVTADLKAENASETAPPKQLVEILSTEAGLGLESVARATAPEAIHPGVAMPTQDIAQPTEPKSSKAAASAQPDKIAQTIVRAKMSSASTALRPQRLILVGSAGLTAAGLASVLLGWIDPVSLLSPKAGVEPISQMAAANVPQTTPAPTPAPALAPAAIIAEPASKPANDLMNARLASKTQQSLKAGTGGRAPAPMPGAAAGTSGNPKMAVAPMADCGTGSLASDCRLPSRPVAKARPKTALPKPPEPTPTLTAKVPGPNQLELGYQALTQGRMTEAAVAYNSALAENPDERDALLGLAYIAHQAAREEEARDLYKRVLRQEPGNPSARAGLLIQTLGNNAEDVSDSSREVAEQHPGSAAAQSVLGHSLVRQGRLADAQQAFQRAHLLEAGVALHAYNLAVAFDRLRSYGPARTYYERALLLSRQNGGEASSGISHSTVQSRLQELQSASAAIAPPTR